MPTRHKTVPMQTAHGSVQIDADVIELIQTLNTIPGLETKNSCQGHFGPAYVQFTDDSPKGSNGTSVRYLQHVIELMDIEARKHSRMEARHVAKHGLRHGTIPFSLYFTVEMGDVYVMRWMTNTYPVLLKITRRVAKQMRSVS